MLKPPFITRVELRNYKSIARCNVELGPLTILVGPNGSGKSNFLDALRLLYRALIWPLDELMSQRGGFREVVRRAGDRPVSFSVAVDFNLPDGSGNGRYGFELTSRRGGGVEVVTEFCEFQPTGREGKPHRFLTDKTGIIECNIEGRQPRLPDDRLFLFSASNTEEFWPVYDALTEIKFYKFEADVLTTPQSPESGDLLHTPNGHNLPGVLGDIEENDPAMFDRIQRYMSALVPGLQSVRKLEIPVVNQETIQFTQQFGDRENPEIFTPINMSDGTLRALAVLTALLQGGDLPPTLVELEELQLGLHPAAAGVLWDALTDGCERTQVIVSTQSPDFLDRHDVPTEAILAFEMDAGRTEIGHISHSSRQLLQERLTTPGELLRQRRLSPKEPLIYPQMPIRFDS